MVGFDVGDLVRILDWDDMAEEFGVDDNGDIKCGATFTKGMRSLCGIEFVVTDIHDPAEWKNFIEIDGLETHRVISSDMIEKLEDDLEIEEPSSFIDFINK